MDIQFLKESHNFSGALIAGVSLVKACLLVVYVGAVIHPQTSAV